jgi:hypothetical protein
MEGAEVDSRPLDERGIAAAVDTFWLGLSEDILLLRGRG